MASTTNPRSKKSGPRMRAHPYSLDIENLVIRQVRKYASEEQKLMRYFLSACFDRSVAENDIVRAMLEADMRSPTGVGSLTETRRIIGEMYPI